MGDMPVYQAVLEYVTGRELGTTRRVVAEHFFVGKSTATYHLEKLVARGLLVKLYTWTGHTSRGWVYYAPRHVNQNLPLDVENA